MAKGEQIEELYISLGLNVDDLKLGFDTAGKTVAQSITKLNSEAKKIQLRTDIDVSKLSGAEHEFERIKMQCEAINRQLDIQKQKEAILQAQLKSNQNKYGADHGLTQRAEMNLLYQQKNVADLEAKLRGLTSSMKGLENQEVKAAKEATTLFSRIKTGAAEAKAGVTSITGELSSGFSMLSAKLAAVMAVASTGAGLFKLTTAAMNAGHETYKLTQRLHMTAGEVGALKRVFDLSGTDLNTIVPFIARIDKQLMSATEKENALSEALDRFNVKLTDEKGKLLQVNEQLEQLAKGYLRAQEAGEEEEFTAEVLGAKGAQLIPVLQDYNDLIGLSKSVVTTGILNPAEAHTLWQEWKLMTMEMGQLKSAMGAALLPVSAELMPEVLAGFQEAVRLVKENKDGIVELGQVIVDVMSMAKDVISTVADLLDSLGINMKNVSEAVHDIRTATKGEYFPRLASGTVGGAATGAGLAAEIAAGITAATGGAAAPAAPFIIGGGTILGGFLGGYGAMKTVKAEDKFKEIRKQEEEAKKKKTPPKKEDNSNEIEQIKKLTAEEKKAAAEAKKAAEEAEKANKEIADSFYTATHNGLQNSLHNIDLQAEKYRERGADEVQIEKWAEAEKAKVIKQFNEEVAKSIDSVWKSEYQNRLDDIEREKKAWEQKGLDEVRATEWAENRKRQLQQETALNMFKQQYKYLQLYREAMNGEGTAEEKQQRAHNSILRQMRADSGITDDMWTTPGEIAGFQDMMNSVKRGLVPIFEEAPRKMMEVISGNMQEIKYDFSNVKYTNPEARIDNSNELEVIRGMTSSFEGSRESITGFTSAVDNAAQVLGEINANQALNPQTPQYYMEALQATSGTMDVARGVVEYNLNVSVTGLDDVENKVAETAAQKIIDKLPSGSMYNISYGS